MKNKRDKKYIKQVEHWLTQFEAIAKRGFDETVDEVPVFFGRCTDARHARRSENRVAQRVNAFSQHKFGSEWRIAYNRESIWSRATNVIANFEK